MRQTTHRNRLGVVAAGALCLAPLGCQAQGSPGARAQHPPPSPEGPKMTQEVPKMSSFQKPSDEELRKRLTREQYEVTQHEGTEAPFRNEYWDNHRPGIYVDVVSGEPLFSSLDKYDSGTGWPSFTRPLEPANIATRTDRQLLAARTEVRSKVAGSHLGHVFDDGPEPTGLRYCMNSAALRFVPAERLAQEGYGDYLRIFQTGGERSARGAGESPSRGVGKSH
jgi:methionine-R-sulfoxide reductase